MMLPPSASQADHAGELRASPELCRRRIVSDSFEDKKATVNFTEAM